MEHLFQLQAVWPHVTISSAAAAYAFAGSNTALSMGGYGSSAYLQQNRRIQFYS